MGSCACGLCDKSKSKQDTEDKQYSSLNDTMTDQSHPTDEEELLCNDKSSESISKDGEPDDNKIDFYMDYNNDVEIETDKLPYYGDENAFRIDQEVRVRVQGCSTWLESHIIAILENNQYRVRIVRSYEFDRYLDDKYIRIIDGEEIRTNSRAQPKLTADTNIPQTLTDLYLNGRKCQEHLKMLTNTIYEMYNESEKAFSIEFIEARHISIEILNYCKAQPYHWRVHCFWCRDFGIKMERATCRHHVIVAGATCIGYYGKHLSLMAFCDECNVELDYEDYSYRCQNQEHDICLSCLWKKTENCRKLNELFATAVPFLDRYSRQSIIEYVMGDIRKFEGDKL